MRGFLTIIILVFSALCSRAQRGLPFFINFSEEEYNAQSNNFDVICDDYGTVFFANFEGLLYYDQSEWRIIHTNNVQRITALYKDKSGRIIVGGNNYLGLLTSSANGALRLKPIIERGNFGQIDKVWKEGNTIWFFTASEKIYSLKNGKLSKQLAHTTPPINGNQKYHEATVNNAIKTAGGMTLLATDRGLIGLDTQGQEVFILNEERGLCNNNVNNIADDGHGGIWGATDSGVFYVDTRSRLSRFCQSEGLVGMVLSTAKYKGTIYAGTQQGLYRYSGHNKFTQVERVGEQCKCLFIAPDGSLLAATGEGVFRITPTTVQQLSTTMAMAVTMTNDGRIFTGGMNGIYQLTAKGHERLVSSGNNRAENIDKLLLGTKGEVWAISINGDYYVLMPGTEEFRKATSKEILANKQVCMHKRFFPNMTYVDSFNLTWTTLADGKGLRGIKQGKDLTGFNQLLYPLHDFVIRTVFRDNKTVLIGGKFGLIYWNITNKMFPKYDANSSEKIYIRSIVQNQGNILWGGYDAAHKLSPQAHVREITFDKKTNKLLFTYSITHKVALGTVEYSYRVDGSEWSEWTTKPFTEFNNPRYGKHMFEVRARDNKGRLSAPASITYTISYPFYLTWWFISLCAIAIGTLTYWLNSIRTKREMMKLERLVNDRTTELKKAQNQLLQQEKVATVGKLTSNLIDRILNPMNYINNFSHLTIGLVKDMKDDLEDEKDNISENNYDDMLDILNMASENLEKIEAHGTNTSRIIKAMEQVLQERKNVFKPYNIVALCQQAINMLKGAFNEQIKSMNVEASLNAGEDNIEVDMNSELILRGLTGMLANSIYSIQKKFKQQPFAPSITISVVRNSDKVSVSLRDNGLGIEQSAIDKVFDPFFTTKTTAEAAGVGLYLTREIVLDHGGTINVESEKNKYCQFNIVLPIKH